MIVDNVFETATVLKDAGFVCSLTPVLAVAIPDVPGGLHRVLGVLAQAGINIEYMYAFLGGKKSSAAYMIFRVTDEAGAAAALTAAGIRLPGQEELSEL